MEESHPLLSAKLLAVLGLLGVSGLGMALIMAQRVAIVGLLISLAASGGMFWLYAKPIKEAIRARRRPPVPSPAELSIAIISAVGSSLLAIYLLMPPTGGLDLPVPELPIITAGVPTVIDPPSSVRSNPDGSERIFVHVSPNDIKKNFDRHTTEQANALNTPYLGKWMALSGSVENIKDEQYGTLIDFTSVATLFSGSMSVQTNFNKEWHDRLSVMNKGDRISMVCQISDIEEEGMALDNCELISP